MEVFVGCASFLEGGDWRGARLGMGAARIILTFAGRS